MNIRPTEIEGLLIIEPNVFEDKRGYFYESYNERAFIEAGIHNRFVQDNQSRSDYGVIRGLHLQGEPHAQAKLIRVIEGSIFDVALDLRKGSVTYGKWFGLEITHENRLQMLVPKGCAHGFSVLSERATVFYKCDDFYHPETESGIRYNDPDLLIDWRVPEERASVSDKDSNLPFFKAYNK
ncbi:MAG: dTDP-4-dehydrorhamnose 3,5-epimerase [Bacteroidales bacterium]